ncbi:hypothetical protein DNTS_008563 [Danionella cerebrum]|uniref:Uncharacterized protein n=1 Tax=Danionella cerebrum TaxID=2873325 RepID=A0A553MYF2_9TELE|nr:hypothetical protein DNTS_008563 [Danionella translucida]
MAMTEAHNDQKLLRKFVCPTEETGIDSRGRGGWGDAAHENRRSAQTSDEGADEEDVCAGNVTEPSVTPPHPSRLVLRALGEES